LSPPVFVATPHVETLASQPAALPPRESKPRLLVVGQAVKPTGYARVLQSIAQELHTTFEILYFAINYRGEPLDAGYRILPNQLMGDVLGREQLPAILQEFQPHLVFMCHDPGYYAVHEPALNLYRQKNPAAKVLFYCPIEWEEMMPGTFASMASLDQLVLYTEFGSNVVQKAFAHELLRTQNLQAPPMSVLPHGLHTDVFYPLLTDDIAGSRRQARLQLFRERPELHDAFIVLNANRNCPRKRVDLTLRAFAEFARDKSDVYLYLHMGMRDSGYDVLELANQLRIRDRLLLTTEAEEKPSVSDEQLNLIYNACDAGINTSTGEGWGLVAFEHGATGAAQIVPEHSACAELWRAHGVLIPLEQNAEVATEPGVVSLAGTIAALEQVYADRRQRNLSAQALAYVTKPEFSWRHIAGRWATLFQQVSVSV
jgi:glycosyltransferase involved in cell wall biosynthesis